MRPEDSPHIDGIHVRRHFRRHPERQIYPDQPAPLVQGRDVYASSIHVARADIYSERQIYPVGQADTWVQGPKIYPVEQAGKLMQGPVRTWKVSKLTSDL